MRTGAAIDKERGREGEKVGDEEECARRWRPAASGKGGPASCEALAIEGRLLKREVEVAVRKGETGGGDR